MIKKSIILYTLLLLAGNIVAQCKSIDLWNGNVPGAIPNADYQQTVDSADNWIKMRFVNEPALSKHYYEEVYNTLDITSARTDFSLLIYPVMSMDHNVTHAAVNGLNPAVFYQRNK